MRILSRNLRVIASHPTVSIQTRCLRQPLQNLSIFHHAAPRAWRIQIRGKKTKASVNLDDLPQGVIPLEPLPLEDAPPAYPTVVQQARSNMRKFENCVLLTRVGGFYELYFEHADEFGPLLNLKVAQKPTKAGPVPMVYSSKMTALARLMQTRPDSPSSSWIDISRFWCKI
jgi:hypothetical protein